MTTPTESPSERSLLSTIGRISALLNGRGALTAGDCAELRRMDPRCPGPAFFKLEGTVLHAELPPEEVALKDHETRWAAVIVGLAHLQELHRRGARLGIALAEAGYSESRFSKLLRADADQLVDELPSLARYLAAKGVPVDWSSAAQLVLSAGQERHENARRHLARDYFGTLARHADR